MRKLLPILLFFISLSAAAQINVKEGSFRKIENYVMIDKDDHTDMNDCPMVLIKISTENINAEQRTKFTYKGNAITYFDEHVKPGEIHLYVSKVANFIEFIHEDFGKCELRIPYDLCDFCAYELVIQHIPLTADSGSGGPKPTYMIVTCDQDNALIYIDGNLVGTKEAQRRFDVGTTHTWKIECSLYHSESGTITLNDRVEINKTLRPAFGYIDIATFPEQGAAIFINNEYIGVSPIRTDKLKSGTYKIRAMKDMYKMTEESYIVADGNITTANINMSANFVNITVKADSQSEIYIDDEYKGKGMWSGRIADGSHTFEARKNNHRASFKTLDLVLGNTVTIELDSPKPIYGSLDITTSPMRAEIYIDGEHYDQTPNYIDNILIGEHELKLGKQGYVSVTKRITIKEGETLSLNEVLNAIGGNNVSKTSNVKNQTFTVNGVSFNMIAVEGGTYNMGATPEQTYFGNDEKPVHAVTLGNYYIGETEVTQELWAAVMNNNPSHFLGDQKPVEHVSWEDCQIFIEKLNQLTGKNFRLPTESEWEYASRGGNKSQGFKYSGSNNIGDVAWYDANSNEQTHNVKTKLPNELGIYDMSGNVYEWCQDRYGNYTSDSQINPQGPSIGPNRVLRGGCWRFFASYCRVSYRNNYISSGRYNYNGLRLAM